MPPMAPTTRWAQAPAHPRLGQGEVHVWRAALAAEDPPGPGRAGCLSRQERLRAERFHFAKDRDRWILARTILRNLLGLYMDRSPFEIEILQGAAGKPFLAQDRLRFNLSHSGDYAVYAFSAGKEVGIDLECSVPLQVGELASAGFLSEGERAELTNLRGKELHEALLRCWTRKEAFIKATGEGMNAPLAEIRVPLGPGSHSFPWPAPCAGAGRQWSLVDIDVAPGCAACLAVEGEAELVPWEWRWPERLPDEPERMRRGWQRLPRSGW